MSERLLTRVAIFVVVYNDKGETLLQRRSGTGFLDGYYDNISGHLESGETIQECGVREAKEEAGIDIAIEDLKLIHVNQNNIDIPYINFTFACSKWSGNPTIGDPDKIDDMGFYPTDNLPDKCTLNIRLLERENFSEDLTTSYVDKAIFDQLVYKLS